MHENENLDKVTALQYNLLLEQLMHKHKTKAENACLQTCKAVTLS